MANKPISTKNAAPVVPPKTAKTDVTKQVVKGKPTVCSVCGHRHSGIYHKVGKSK